jgi:hypothetical protein
MLYVIDYNSNIYAILLVIVGNRRIINPVVGAFLTELENEMKILKAKERGRKETIVDVDAKTVVCHHATAHESLEKGARYQLEWTIDFSKTPIEQVFRAAAEYCVIANRRNLAKVKKPTDADWNQIVVDATPLIPKHVSKLEKARKSLEAFSPEELADMGIVLTEQE